jgi:Flp pilus assembly protein TadG
MKPVNRMRRFARTEDGATMVEFTLVFPIMIALFVGVVEFSEAFAVNRKLTNAVTSVADLVAQREVVTSADLTEIASIADSLMAPFSPAQLGMVISSVEADKNGATKIGWSQARGSASAHAKGGVYAPPSGLTEANSSILMVEGTYQFTPTIAMYLTGTITLSNQAYFRPRASRVIQKTD